MVSAQDETTKRTRLAGRLGPSYLSLPVGRFRQEQTALEAIDLCVTRISHLIRAAQPVAVAQAGA